MPVALELSDEQEWPATSGAGDSDCCCWCCCWAGDGLVAVAGGVAVAEDAVAAAAADDDDEVCWPADSFSLRLEPRKLHKWMLSSAVTVTIAP